ncbi:MAG TPA: hypothetical protein VFP21_10285 [Solirubrobacterales bacterium]|nr:hypothetical protein [Solirubrobacterales bacterium]
MSRSVIRRTTAAVALLGVLALALPAGAAPVGRQAPAPVASVGFFDQLLSWLGLWTAPTTAAKPPVRAKALTSGSTTSTTTSSLSSLDRGGMIDPNGGS